MLAFFGGPEVFFGGSPAIFANPQDFSASWWKRHTSLWSFGRLMLRSGGLKGVMSLQRCPPPLEALYFGAQSPSATPKLLY